MRKTWMLVYILLVIIVIFSVQHITTSQKSDEKYFHPKVIYGASSQNRKNSTRSTDNVLYQKKSQSARSTDPTTFNVNLKLGRWDNKRLYKFFDFALPGDQYVEISNKYNICLATQSSLERLHSLAEVANHWSGTISVSVFIAGNEFSLVEFYVSYLRQCFPQIRDRVSFHLAFSPYHPPHEDHFNFPINQDCGKTEEVLKELVKYRSQETSEWRENTVYPQNHLRNQARKNCQSSYVFLTDIDIIPSYGMAEEVDLFLKTVPCEKLCAYVIPVYEIDDNASFPNNKFEVVQLSRRGIARPFHQKIYETAQLLTDYKRWEESVADEDEPVHVSHVIQKYEEWYEPFFIALDTAPPYDERFIGYGYTRNTQTYEMNAAGYVLKVLSPVFACHWHLQTVEEDYYPWRNEQLNINRERVSKFKSEISARYPNESNFSFWQALFILTVVILVIFTLRLLTPLNLNLMNFRLSLARSGLQKL